MNTLFVDGIEKYYGSKCVLAGCRLQVGTRDRIGLVGANGAGKSTLLRIITGEEKPDHGHVHTMGSIAFLSQEPKLQGKTVQDAVSQATKWHSDLLEGYERAIAAGELEKGA